MPVSNLLAPIEVPYKLAAPLSWARAMLKPLGMALRQLVPSQAHAQHDMSALDREFKVTAATDGGWIIGLRFSGPGLVVSLYPPEIKAVRPESFAGATLNDDLSDIYPAADPIMEPTE